MRLADEGFIIVRLGTDDEDTDRVYIERVTSVGIRYLEQSRRRAVAADRRALRAAALVDILPGGRRGALRISVVIELIAEHVVSSSAIARRRRRAGR